MTARHGFAISPNGFFARYSFIPALSELRAQGMPGARCARGLVCNGSGRAHTSVQVTPESPGIPRAMVLRIIRALPGAPLFDSHIFEPQSGAVFDATEGFDAYSHHLWSWFSVIGRPPSKSGNDPGSKSKRTLGMGVLLSIGCPFQLNRQSFKHRP